MNKSWPKMDPWGTPVLEKRGLDNMPPTRTMFGWLFRQSRMNMQRLLQTPYRTSFWIRRFWSTKSKALDRSKYTTSTWPRLAMIQLVHPTNVVRLVSTDQPFRNTWWASGIWHIKKKDKCLNNAISKTLAKGLSKPTAWFFVTARSSLGLNTGASTPFFHREEKMPYESEM